MELNKNSEHNHQVSFFHYVRVKAVDDERYRNIYAHQNEQVFASSLPKKTFFKILNWLKAAGLEPGVFDIAVDWPSNGYHGMRIEMKSSKGRLSKAQEEWKRRYEKAGYYVVVCRDFEQACQELIAYFDGYLHPNLKKGINDR